MSPISFRVLRAPFERRARAEFAYVLAGLPLAAIGFGYALAAFLLGTALAITAIGIPLVAAAVVGARWFGGLHRRLVAALLGERVASPDPFRRTPGIYGWVQSGLADGPGWRAVAYLLLKLPLAVIAAYVVTFTWVWGVVALTYPAQRALGLNAGTALDRPLWEVLLPFVGLALLLIAPWAVRGMILLDKLLIHALLGPDRSSSRIRDLEETRARAVDDAAATLRRIERDLHDGAQVKLVALAMDLAMIKESPEATPAIRELAGGAQHTAREAIAELRDLVRGIHPPVLDAGLDAALAGLTAGSGLPISLTTDLPTRPSPAIETIAYFCAAELVANATKHSGAAAATIDVTAHRGWLHLEVGDNGSGGARLGAGSGLRGLTDRVRTVDGHLDIDSPPGGPTVITVDLPLHA